MNVVMCLIIDATCKWFCFLQVLSALDFVLVVLCVPVLICFLVVVVVTLVFFLVSLLLF